MIALLSGSLVVKTMVMYAQDRAYCSNCRRFQQIFLDETRCPVCGGRMKTKPSRKKSCNDLRPYVLRDAIRCGNCKVRLEKAGDEYVCPNEYCGMRYSISVVEVAAHG